MVSKSIAGSAKVTMNAGGILAFVVGVILVIVGIVNVKSNTSHVNPEVDKLLDEIKRIKITLRQLTDRCSYSLPNISCL